MSSKGKQKDIEKPEREAEIAFLLKMTIRKLDQSQVTYKYDADRFEREDTLKLRIKTEYSVSVEIEPSPKVRLR